MHKGNFQPWNKFFFFTIIINYYIYVSDIYNHIFFIYIFFDSVYKSKYSEVNEKIVK